MTRRGEILGIRRDILLLIRDIIRGIVATSALIVALYFLIPALSGIGQFIWPDPADELGPTGQLLFGICFLIAAFVCFFIAVRCALPLFRRLKGPERIK